MEKEAIEKITIEVLIIIEEEIITIEVIIIIGVIIIVIEIGKIKIRINGKIKGTIKGKIKDKGIIDTEIVYKIIIMIVIRQKTNIKEIASKNKTQ